MLSISATSFCMASCQEEEERWARSSMITPVEALEEIVEQGSGVETLVLFYDRIEREAVSPCFTRVQEFFETLAFSSHENWKEKAAAYLGLGLMCHKGHYAFSSEDLFEDAGAKRRADLKRAWQYANKARRTFRATLGTQQSAKKLMIELLCDPAFQLEAPVTDLDRYEALGRLRGVLDEDEFLYELVRKERARLVRQAVLQSAHAQELLEYEHILQDETSALVLKEAARDRRRKLLQNIIAEGRTCARTRVYLEGLS